MLTERPPAFTFFKWRGGLYMVVNDHSRDLPSTHFRALVLRKSPTGGSTKEGHLTIFAFSDDDVIFITPEEV